MEYLVEIVVIVPTKGGEDVDRLPKRHKTFEAAVERGVQKAERVRKQRSLPPGAVTFRVVDESGEPVDAPPEAEKTP